MKHPNRPIPSLFLWIAIGISALGSVGVAAQEEPTPKLAEIVSRSIAAQGGGEAWKAIRSLRLRGDVEMGDGNEAKIVIEFKRPFRIRIDMQLQGMTMTQAYDGEKGWAVIPFSGSAEPRPLSEDILSAMHQQADFEGPLLNHEAKGYGLKLLGPATFDDREALELEVSPKVGPSFFLLLDAESYQVLAMRVTRSMQGNDINYMLSYSDYREVEGITLPFVQEQSAEQLPFVQRITLNKVEPNADIADERFAHPG